MIESDGDVALPLEGVGIDAVAVVEPGRARMFDGDRYLAACELADDAVLAEAVE
ncbi:MAG: hypothetical protein ACOC0F_00670 [archaeon]